MTTVVSTPTANGSATKNGDLPNIKPLKVNGESTPAAEEVKTTEEKKEEKLTNGDHHEEEKKAENVSEEKTNGETEPVNNEINGKHNVEVAAQEAEPTSA